LIHTEQKSREIDAERFSRIARRSWFIVPLRQPALGFNLGGCCSGWRQSRPQFGGALHSAFSGLSHVGADRPFAAVALGKTRRPWTRRTFNTLGLKAFPYRPTRKGSRSSPRVWVRLTIDLSWFKDGTCLMRLPSGLRGTCAPPAATPLKLTRVGDLWSDPGDHARSITWRRRSGSDKT
jgi:hypothetical protein